MFCRKEIAPPESMSAELLMKLVVPLKFSDVLKAAKMAPPWYAELLMKLLVPLKLRDVLVSA